MPAALRDRILTELETLATYPNPGVREDVQEIRTALDAVAVA